MAGWQISKTGNRKPGVKTFCSQPELMAQIGNLLYSLLLPGLTTTSDGLVVRPTITVLKLVQIRRAKRLDEILDEFILWFLLQCNTQQLELFRGFTLTRIVGKTKVAREAQLKILDRKLVEPAVVQTLHPEGDDRFDFVAFRSQGGNEFAWQIFV